MTARELIRDILNCIDDFDKPLEIYLVKTDKMGNIDQTKKPKKAELWCHSGVDIVKAGNKNVLYVSKYSKPWVTV